MNHTDKCQQDHARHAALVAKFESDHPNYCLHCGGWGMVVSAGCSVPYGSTSASLPDDVDPCPHCVEQGKCPICGADSISEECGICVACGWEDGEIDGIPEGPECLCWLGDYGDE